MRAGTASRAESSRRLRSRVDRPVQNSIGQATTPTRARSRLRSRHRSRSQAVEVTTSRYNYTPTQESRLSRGRLRERSNTRTSKPSSSGSNYHKKSPSKSSMKVHFPKKNLFPSLPKFRTPQITLLTVGSQVSRQKTKVQVGQEEHIAQRKTLDHLSHTGPLKTKQNVGLQSGKQDSSEINLSVIIVTHQVPTRTVFTIVEKGVTKSLHASSFETSLLVRRTII